MLVPFVEECKQMLQRTPAVLGSLLAGMPTEWTELTEGPGTWSPFVVVGHLAHGERADWVPRLRTVLREGESRTFDVFDREAQFQESRGKTMQDLLAEFAEARQVSLEALDEFALRAEDLERTGMHPDLGRVTVRQLLATWTAHDLAHILQISRALAKRFQHEVGPWAEFLSVMR